MIKSSTKVFLVLGIALNLFTSMNGILVPGQVFDAMQSELGLDAAALASLSSCYMIAMAVSQFSIGLFTDRIGGVRVVLLGGFTFCLGVIMFPLCSSIWLLRLARIISAFGAGIVFLGNSRIIADIYPERFTSMLGLALVVGYSGPTVGTTIVPMLRHAFSWRIALMVPAVLATAIFAMLLFFMPPHKKTLSTPKPILQPFAQILRNRQILQIFLASSIMFGAYYALQTIMGAKCLMDAGNFQSKTAFTFMTCLTLVIVSLNFIVGPLCKRINGHNAAALRTIIATCLAGAALCIIALRLQNAKFLLLLGFVFITIPAGFFSIYGTFAKSHVSQDCVALVVALLNFSAFVMISTIGAITGYIMHHYEDAAQTINNITVYPAAAYQGVFSLFIVTGLISLVATLGIKRTN